MFAISHTTLCVGVIKNFVAFNYNVPRLYKLQLMNINSQWKHIKTMFKDKYDITFDFIQTQTIREKKAGVKRRGKKRETSFN